MAGYGFRLAERACFRLAGPLMGAEERITAAIGFGEAGHAFLEGLPGDVRAWDKAEPVRSAGHDHIRLPDDPCEALAGVPLILSLVTAAEALNAARTAAPLLAPGALFCDMNSVAPGTKRQAAVAVEAGGGRYVDVAVMSPVNPSGRNAPLLVAGPHAEAGAEALRARGFTRVRVVGAKVGDASSIKMIRSVMVKGMEALSAECALAASRAGVLDEVTASLDASWREEGWAQRFDYNLDRMLVHGVRRAEEMEEVVKTLDALGTGSVMTRGTVVRQRALGQARHSPEGLNAKIETILQPEAAE